MKKILILFYLILLAIIATLRFTNELVNFKTFVAETVFLFVFIPAIFTVASSTKNFYRLFFYSHQDWLALSAEIQYQEALPGIPMVVSSTAQDAEDVIKRTITNFMMDLVTIILQIIIIWIIR